MSPLCKQINGAPSLWEHACAEPPTDPAKAKAAADSAPLGPYDNPGHDFFGVIFAIRLPFLKTLHHFQQNHHENNSCKTRTSILH